MRDDRGLAASPGVRYRLKMEGYGLHPGQVIRIGRVPDNDLVLTDLNVSRHHAELRRNPDGSFELADLGSHGGTFVNGQRNLP